MPSLAPDEHVGNVTARLISTRTIIERDGSTQRTLLVMCPMEDQTLSVERCVACPMCARLDASNGSVGRPSVACTFEAPSVSGRTRAVGSALARDAVCMRLEAMNGTFPPMPLVGLLPVVDANLRLVGVLEKGHLRADDDTLGLTIEEHTPIPAALTRMVRHRMRHAPVVARDGTVLGVLDDLDGMRALRVLMPE
jgi:hypothetical protein